MDSLAIKNKDEITSRCNVLITYSHWEGHFKKCAAELLNFMCEGVRRKIFKWTDFEEEIRLRLIFCKFRKSSVGGQSEETFIDHLNALNNQRYFDLQTASDEIILIDDNLNSLRAATICRNLGVEHAWCSLKKVVIDERLLAYRNALAHGSERLRDGTELTAYSEEISEALEETRSLIRQSKDKFSNAIEMRSFLA